MMLLTEIIIDKGVTAPCNITGKKGSRENALLICVIAAIWNHDSKCLILTIPVYLSHLLADMEGLFIES